MFRPLSWGAWAAMAMLITRPPCSQAREHFRDAVALEVAGDYQDALEIYEGLLREDPQHRLAATAAFGAANLRLLALQDTVGAVDAFDVVVARYPESAYAPEAARRKAECLVASSSWAKAAEAYGSALELAGREAEAPSAQWVNEVSLAAADCLYQSGDRDRVIMLYEKALQPSLAPHAAAQIVFRLGEAYQAAGDSTRAADCFVRVVRDYPFAPVFGVALQQRSFVDRHAEFDWDDYLVYARTAQDFAVPDYEMAIARCDTVLSRSANETLRLCASFRRVVATTTLEGDFTRGASELAALLASLPDRRMMPNAQLQLDHFTMVADAEATALRTPDDPAAHRALGTFYLQSRANAKAVAALEKARDLAPDEGHTRILLGMAYAGENRLDDAEREFAAFLSENPDDPNALNRMGYALLGQNEAERALPYFRRYVEAAPEDANAYDSLGEGLLAAGQVEDAVRAYERAIQLDSLFANSYFMLATACERLGNGERAGDAYRRFIELAPDDPRTPQARQALAGADN
ncbi:tetratricopeptide repeat protein [Candidatus Fermentibacteria bacterium]|nr:tetratricopeptide repeat protein [Candidatus Fermentibacteria bacterium]